MLSCSVMHALETARNHNGVIDHDLTVNVYETF